MTYSHYVLVYICVLQIIHTCLGSVAIASRHFLIFMFIGAYSTWWQQTDKKSLAVVGVQRLGGGVNDCLFLPLLGEMIKFD